MAKKHKDICKHCKFWCRVKKHCGECRKFEPRVYELNDRVITYFPQTNDDGVCGGYKSGNQPKANHIIGFS